MPDWTLHEWLVVIIPAGAAVIAMMTLMAALLAWRRPRRPRSDPSREIKRYEAYHGKEYPAIHATSGVPTLSQLTDGVDLDARRLGLARRLYESGFAQFNHYVNNRDGMIEESRGQMARLVGGLGETEISKAESVGTSLAVIEDCEQGEADQSQYKHFSPQAQIYAQHKRRETEAIRSIARDLETNTPRTDYTSVKARIASGNVRLDSIMSELPIAWQDIRTLNEKAERPKLNGRPPKRELLHLILMTRDQGELEDKRAEKDGNWIISNKHEIMVPNQAPVPTFVHLKEGAPPVRKSEAVVVTHDQGSQWETEFWRKGGRLDQVYLRAKSGSDPEQLWRAYRRRLVNRAAWVVCGALLIGDIILFFRL